MKAYKTEIILSDEQKLKYEKTVGVCRYIYNLFIAINQERYSNGLKYLNNFEFALWLNHTYLKENLDKCWIKEVSSKSVLRSISNAHNSFIRFFKKQSGFPRFKKKSKDKTGMYFVRTSLSCPIKCERHRIKIPTLGWVKLKEYGYIPLKDIISGVITKISDRYYISIITDQKDIIFVNNIGEGIGVDLGLKDFAILSNGDLYKTKKYKKEIKKLKREQRNLSKKSKNKKEGDSTKNLEKQILKVAKIYHHIFNIRNDYQNKIVFAIIKRKPSFITIEDLNISGMMKNRHLSKAIANQGFYSFIAKLKYKAYLNFIEIRVVGRFYPSSKLCSCCGNIKSDLKLSDRVYICECGNKMDRDLNAAINLKNAKSYTIAQ